MSTERSRPPRRPAPPGGEPYTDETRALPRQRPAASGRPAVSRRPRRSLWARVRLALLAAVAVALVALGLLYWQVHSLAQAVTVAEVRNNPPIASPLIGANVLIIGTDERSGHPEEGVRGDTLILARLDAAGRWASLLSIPRDSQVAIPRVGLDQTKINVAYGQGYANAQELYGPGATPQQGGMALAAQTVEEFLGLRDRGMKVDFVATVNFAGFAGLIDALGGVTIDVPAYILDEEYPTEDFGVMRVEFQPGPQRMDGATALIYARTRHQDSDFGRAERQQQVVRAIMQEFRAKGPVGQTLLLPGLLRAVAGEGGGTQPVLTTMPIDRLDVLLGLLGLAGGLDPDALGQFRLGAEQLAYEDGSNLIFDPAATQALLDQWQRPPSEAREHATVQVFNGTEVPGLARQVSLDIERSGFRILPPGNGPAADRTRVYDVGGAPATSRRLARTLGAELVSGPPPGDVLSEATIVVVIGPDAKP
ncbi:MAG: LCP family protein [Chloroflexales bacterium]|nr:LCP family protein [Chloroflexales bacterium]